MNSQKDLWLLSKIIQFLDYKVSYLSGSLSFWLSAEYFENNGIKVTCIEIKWYSLEKWSTNVIDDYFSILHL